MSSWFPGGSVGRTVALARGLWRSSDAAPPNLDAELEGLKEKIPAPVLWLFGKTQSGKTSLIRYLTGAEDAAIGNGFQACTKNSREYPFPTADVPVLTFLDTRGVEEPGYDPAEDIATFDDRAHLIAVTCRIKDFAHGNLRASLGKIRKANPSRPVILVLTCLHEVNPTEQHTQPYPFDPLAGKPGHAPTQTGSVSEELNRLIAEQTKQFAGLVDRVVPVDLTVPDEGYEDIEYGGPALKRVLLDSLPGAYRETLRRMTEITKTLSDAHMKRAVPVIIAYSSMAATAGTIPVPFLDLLLIPGIQAKMVTELAKLYGQPWTATRFLEAAASMGLGLVARQAVREVVKFIPFVGSAAGAALAYASTYALGRAYCEYFEQIHHGHIPSHDSVKKLYNEQFQSAETMWFQGKKEA